MSTYTKTKLASTGTVSSLPACLQKCHYSYYIKILSKLRSNNYSLSLQLEDLFLEIIDFKCEAISLDI